MSSRPEYLNDDSVFVQKVESDRNVCSSCYRKIREHTDPHPSLPDSVDGSTEYEDHVDTGYFDDFKESGRPSVEKKYCVCGVVDWNDAKIRPLDTEEMQDAGRRISDRLSESDVEHDPLKLLWYINENAPLPENQFREEKVFEEAVRVAVSEVDGESDDDSDEKVKV